jgi:hypothetical protein
MGGGWEDGRPLNGEARVAVVVGGHERGVLARQRPGYMVMDLDLEEKIERKEKSRTGSATGARTVENIGVLGLGYNPNQHNKGRPKKTKKRPPDPVQEKHNDEPGGTG